MTLRRRLLLTFACGCTRCGSMRWRLFRGAHHGIPIPVAAPPVLWRSLRQVWSGIVARCSW